MKNPKQSIRRMGFVRDQEGIMNRYLRESSNWKEHLERTRRFIMDSFVRTEIETLAVLGSGWLLDVPLDHLLERFRHIYLVDIHHSIQVRKRVSSLKQVELIEADLTGGAVELIWEYYNSGKRPSGDGPAPLQLAMKAPLAHIQPDAYISVNLLNQLDIFLCDYILKQKHYQQEELIPFRASIQAFHVDWISKLPGCLISDILEEVEGPDGEKSAKALLHTRLPEGIRSERWWWDFDTQGTYHPGSRTRMEVQAIEWS